MSAPILVTIPISHYCEKARWALDLAGVAYVEEPHPPFLHMLRTKRSGVGRSTPQLWLPEQHVVPDSSGIVAYADQYRGGDFLLPTDPTQRAEVDAWVARFDSKIGPHVRRVAYFHLLDRPDLVVPMLTRGTAPHVRRTYRAAFPLVRRLMRSALRIDAAGAARSRATTYEELDAVAKALADGRRYLVGNRFTSADLTLAALIGTFVGPPEHPMPRPRDEDLPPGLLEESLRLRAHPVGAFVTRMYAEHRRPRATR